jgi:plastocyanin
MRPLFLTLIAVLFSAALANAETKEFKIIIKDHLFIPAQTKIPAGERVKLVIDNQDSTPEEFESYDLNREKIISGNSKSTVYVGPVTPGNYKYFGEFNEATAQGLIIAE